MLCQLKYGANKGVRDLIGSSVSDIKLYQSIAMIKMIGWMLSEVLFGNPVCLIGLIWAKLVSRLKLVSNWQDFTFRMQHTDNTSGERYQPVLARSQGLNQS